MTRKLIVDERTDTPGLLEISSDDTGVRIESNCGVT